MEKVIVKGYTVEIYYDKQDKIFVASALELPGCMTHGNTQEEAIAEMKIAIDLHIEECKESGNEFAAKMDIYA